MKRLGGQLAQLCRRQISGELIDGVAGAARELHHDDGGIELQVDFRSHRDLAELLDGLLARKWTKVLASLAQQG